MIITIDTNKDSVEDIRKAVRLLQQLTGDAPISVSTEPHIATQPAAQAMTPTAAASDGFAAMFGDMQPMAAATPSFSTPAEEPQIIGLPVPEPEQPKRKVRYEFETY